MSGGIGLARNLVEADPAWLPDVFAAVFDLLEHDQRVIDLAATLRSTAAEDETMQVVRGYLPALRRAQAVAVGSLTPEFCAFLIQGLDWLESSRKDDGLLRCVRALRTLEYLLRGIEFGAPDEGTAYTAIFRAQLWQGRTLVRNSTLGGHLLTRAAPRHDEIKEVSDYFRFVVRVPEAKGFTLDYSRFRTPLFDVPPGTPVQIGVIPVTQHWQELEWTIPSDDYYHVCIRNDKHALLQQRVTQALEWLSSQGADIIVMPELVGSPEIQEIARQWRARRSAPLPRLILAASFLCSDSGVGATGAAEFRNRAAVIGPAGTILWQQDKMHSYVFRASHQQATNFTALEPYRDLTEGIAVTPRRLAVRDLGPGQRLCILICEDFSRSQPYGSTIIRLGVTRIFVPVMNGSRPSPTGRGDWIRDYGLAHTRDPGTISLVVNSGTLVNRTDRTPEWYDFIEVFDPSIANITEVRTLPDSPITAPPHALIFKVSTGRPGIK